MVRTASQVMTDETFDALTAHIEEQYHEMAERATGYRDQQFAQLYLRSGWTQERIAEKVGATQGRISQQLTFGRFLEFITTGNKGRKPPKNLTERRFRGYWERTNSGDKEQLRFRDVRDMMEDELILHSGTVKKPERAEKIAAACADGKWRTIIKMSEKADYEPHEIKAFLRVVREDGCGRNAPHHVNNC